MKWIKLWTEETVRGTTFVELDAASRGIWFSFLALAGIDGSGIIQAGINRGYPIELLAHLINVQNDELKEAVTKLVTFKKIKLLEHGEIEIINWTKYQDEYHRQKPYRITKQKIKEKQQGLQEQLQPKLQEKLQQRLPADKDKEEEEDIKEKHIRRNDFEEVWKEFPRKAGKTKAEERYYKQIKTEEEKNNLLKALQNYRNEIQRLGTEERYIKHGSTFMNNWRDYLIEKSFAVNPPQSTAAKPPLTRDEKIKYAIDLELAGIRSFHKDWPQEKVKEYMEAFKIKAEKGIPQEALQSA